MPRTMKSASKILESMSDWPESWAIDEGDNQKGAEIVAALKGFAESLVELGLAPTTIRRHVNNLWLLGGEIIRELNFERDQREKTASELLKDSVDDEGGPYCRHLETEAEMKSFDATCKKLNAYLEKRRSI
jgi:hypothetical protein